MEQTLKLACWGDSEALANAVLAEIVTELGRPITARGFNDLYIVKRFADVMTAVEANTGAALIVGNSEAEVGRLQAENGKAHR